MQVDTMKTVTYRLVQVLLLACTIACTMAACNRSESCCITGQLLAYSYGDSLLTIEATVQGQCSSDKISILCKMDGSTCKTPLYALEKTETTLSISTGENTFQASCIAGDCSYQATSWEGVYSMINSDLKYFQGAMYHFGDDLMSFTDAKSYCEDMGATLASVTSKAENDFIYALKPEPLYPRWLGASVAQEPEFSISWIDGTEFVDFSVDPGYDDCRPAYDCLFQKNEPNNFDGSEFCLSQGHPVRDQNPSGWNDASCELLKHPVCKMQLTCASSLLGKSFFSTTTCEAAEVGTECTASCDTGFEPEVSSTVTCQPEGVFDGFPDCAPKDCGETIPGLSSNVVANCGNVDTTYGGICIPMCEPGYVSAGGLGFYICTADGVWEGSMNCEPIDCGTSPEGLASTVIANCVGDTRYGGDACVAECIEGYEMSTGNGIFQCNTAGSWIGSINCVLKDCGAAPTDPTFADVSCTATTYGSTCEVTCADGYQLSDPASKTLTCSSDATWVGDVVCEKSPCPSTVAQSDPNAVPAASCDDVVFGDTCTYECAAGYVKVSGSGSYVCQADGFYGQGDLVCEPQACPLVPVALFNSEVSNNQCPKNVQGDVCTAQCLQGYSAFNSSTQSVPVSSSKAYECTLGAWIELEDTECLPNVCGFYLPTVDNAYQPKLCDSTAVGGRYLDSCTIACAPGYELVSGSLDYTCGAQGQWIGDAVCERKDCGAVLDTVMNGQNTTCVSTLFEDTCTVSCSSGYVTAEGTSPVFTCGPDGNWSGDLQCVPIDCGSSITNISSMYATATCTGMTTYLGDTCDATCLSGYDYVSGGEFTCNAEGNWVGSITCTPVDCGPYPSGLPIAAQAECAGSTVFGDTCTASCIDGFMVKNGTSNILQCNENAEWESNLDCVRVDCGSEIEFLDENASTQCMSNTKFEAECEAQCNPGYEKIAGDYYFSCNADGDWEGALLCGPVDCGSEIAGLPFDATATCTGNTAFGGDNCTATCLPGYEGDAAEFYCGTSGQWIGAITCKPRDCGAKVRGLGGTNFLNGCNGDTTYGGDNCTVRCESGYDLYVIDEVDTDMEGSGSFPLSTLVTSQDFYCNTDGAWTGPKLTCNRKDCNVQITDLDINAFGLCLNDTRFGGDDCIATCNENYTATRGDGVFTCSEDGKWEGTLVCELFDCLDTIVSLPPTASATCVGDTRVGGDPCVASCNPGYEYEEALYRCVANTGWAGFIDCTPLDCGDISVALPNNAVAQCSDTVFAGDGCQATCDEGFIQSGSGTYTCNTSGEWEGSISCEIQDCGSLEDVADPNSRVTCNATTFGETCSARCNFGYDTVAGDGAYTCNARGEWEGDLACQRVTCGSVGSLLGPQSVLVDTECASDDNACLTAAVTCSPGYELAQGDGILSCGLDGTWSGSTRCLRVDCGYEIESLSTDATHQICIKSLFEDTCTASCKSGYIPVSGSGVYTCGTAGEWEGELECERVSCGSAPSKLPPGVSGTCTETLFQDECTLGCSSGLIQSGSGTFVCSRTGEWIGGCGLECLDPSLSVQAGDFVHRYNAVPKSFDDARAACESQDTVLSSVSSVAELQGFNSVVGVEPAWVGGVRNESSSDENDFYWLDGSEFPTDAWAAGEPNNYRRNEGCVSINKRDTTDEPVALNDARCALEIPYFCEQYRLGDDGLSCLTAYTLVFASERIFDPNGYRFSTAFETQAQLFTLDFELGHNPESVASCQRRCTVLEECKGFFFQIRATDARCVGLSSLGSKLRTHTIGYSYIKDGNEVPVPTTTTSSTSSSSTSSTSSSFVTTGTAPAPTASPSKILITSSSSSSTSSSVTTPVTTPSVTTPFTPTVTTPTPSTATSPCSEFVQVGFEISFFGATDCGAADGLRFNTAFDSSSVINRFKNEDADNCFADCQADANCKGVFYWTTKVTRATICNTLSALGSPASTSEEGFSYTKLQ
eukprot:m.10121 g.10121  ORF g.10121 m.10121 type:complete len:1945 (+) comp5528_c0_seq1:252-6086(+)